MKYKAVLFDLDGTLLDTIEDIANSMNNVLRNWGFPTHKVQDYKYFVGNGMDILTYHVLPENKRDDKIIKKMQIEMKKEYDKKWHENTKLYKGVYEMLEGLTSRGIKLSILSNKPDYFTKMIVSKILFKWDFYPVFGFREGFPKKPDPYGAIEISNILKIPSYEFLYLGDTGVDMITANRAGMYPIGVLWGFRTQKELLENGAKILIKSPEELLDLIS